MKRFRVWGFSTKLLLAFLLVIVLTVMLMSLLLSGIESYLLDDMEEAMVRQLHSARVAVELSVSKSRINNLSKLGDEGTQSLRQLAAKLGEQTGCRLIITDREGVELADSEVTRAVGLNLSANEELQLAMTVGYGSARRQDPQSKKATMYVAYPVMRDSDVLGAIRISQPTRRVDRLIRSTRRRMWESALIAAGAAVLLSAGLALVLARPIRKISRTATAFGSGDLDARSRVAGSSEIADLSRAFDSMAERIETMVQELRELDTMKSDFVANVSHELKTPLTAIKGLSETLRDGAADDSDVKCQFLNSIIVESQRLLLMVSNLLNLSTAERGALSPGIEPFDVEAGAVEVAGRFAPVADKKGVSLEILADSRPATALGDRAMFELSLSNVIDNAVRFSPTGGPVRVSWEQSRGSIVLSVSDEGPGIDPENRDKVFERFESGTARGRLRGSGLGLSIARLNLELQGGSIEIGETGGNGTTMVLRIPRAEFDKE